jgi:phosphoribosylformylglycinamidine synthase
MNPYRRVYVEKKEGFDVEAQRLQAELADFLGAQHPCLGAVRLRILRRYDVSGLSEEPFRRAVEMVFSEPQCDRVFYGAGFPVGKTDRFFGIEYVPGQYDQRSDSAEQCAELVLGVRPQVKTAEIPGGPVLKPGLPKKHRPGQITQGHVLPFYSGVWFNTLELCSAEAHYRVG